LALALALALVLSLVHVLEVCCSSTATMAGAVNGDDAAAKALLRLPPPLVLMLFGARGSGDADFAFEAAGAARNASLRTPRCAKRSLRRHGPYIN